MSATSMIRNEALDAAAKHRVAAVAALRTAGRMILEDAAALEAGQPALGGHREDATKLLATAQDYIAAAYALTGFANQIGR